MNLPLMPKATAVWLIENTSLTFKQIADFCGLHELEIKGIADGDVAIGIKAYNPILSNQLTRDEIEASSQDPNRPLKLVEKDVDFEVKKMVGTKYTPISQREDKPNAIAWLTKNYSNLTDAQNTTCTIFNDNEVLDTLTLMVADDFVDCVATVEAEELFS